MKKRNIVILSQSARDHGLSIQNKFLRLQFSVTEVLPIVMSDYFKLHFNVI